jgi:arginine/lysine/ornithine decarboxylase
MDHSRAPVLEALTDYHRQDRYGFSPPGHRQGRGADERVLEVLGHQPFRDDVLASGGLDDCPARHFSGTLTSSRWKRQRAALRQNKSLRIRPVFLL